MVLQENPIFDGRNPWFFRCLDVPFFTNPMIPMGFFQAPAIGATGATGAIGWGRDAAFFSGQVYVQEARQWKRTDETWILGNKQKEVTKWWL